MGTAIERHQSQTRVYVKAAGYGMESAYVDGMDVAAVESAMQRAMDFVRNGKPFLLEAQTYRFRAHSMYDAELYRDKEEVERWKQRDPIILLQKRLRAAGQLTDDDVAAIEAEVARQVQDAVDFAEKGPIEPVEDLLKDVHTPVLR
jgi:TPP-dependent pyruvate/acetoin dehydrogenase alpha subunit